ncbi:MAG TPA: sugar ABC transporter permease [Dehalococcoidia bacterium]|nr:sugar ABC transporter permease [Dehalococcoidia bacterium]
MTLPEEAVGSVMRPRGEGALRGASWWARTRLREGGLAIALLLPSLVLFGLFTFYPLIRSAYLGFFRSDPFGRASTYVGFEQYADVLGSEAFRESLRVTALFALYTVPTGLVLGLTLALLAHQRLRGITIYRTIFSSTIASSVAVASVMWLSLLNARIGVLNYVLREVGADPIDWLTDPAWALPAVSLTTIWLNLGFTCVVMLAGLQRIPEELYEAVKVDGGGVLARFWHVTLPMLSPTLLFGVVVLTILAFQSFGQIDILTGGGPLGETNVIVYSIYTDAFKDFNEGQAAAQATILFGIILAFTLAQLWLLERRVFYAE